VVFHPDRCLGCGNCVDACPFGAVFWNEVENKPQICVYCGICAQYCPYDVIALEEVANDEE
jgi:NAD-dependent dihydropyrimidine dehydrogenase PreA subunit